ncbi:serine-rich adhesin for platelets-like isoform X2 [Palaemon carinicauda]|uniref:serine-rich adhesin for platelets-like isoform X2 n=1 Tax=Palaemon carinicauda TaxID=392227 RepID=UPI0035B5F946
MVRCCFCCYCCCCRRCWRLRGVYHVSPRTQSRATTTTTTSTTTTTATRPGGGWTSRISGLLRSFHSQSTPETTQLSTFGTKSLPKAETKKTAIVAAKDSNVPSDFLPEATAVSSFEHNPPQVSQLTFSTCAQDPEHSYSETTWTTPCTHVDSLPCSKVPHCALESDSHNICGECIQTSISQKSHPVHCNHVHCFRHIHRLSHPHAYALPHSCSSACIEAHVCKYHPCHRCAGSEGAEVVHFRRRASHPGTAAEAAYTSFSNQHKITLVDKSFPPCGKADDSKGDSKSASFEREAGLTEGAEAERPAPDPKDSVLAPGAEEDCTQSVSGQSSLQGTEVVGQPSIRYRISERNVKIYQSFSKKWQKFIYKWSSSEVSKDNSKTGVLDSCDVDIESEDAVKVDDGKYDSNIKGDDIDDLSDRSEGIELDDHYKSATSLKSLGNTVSTKVLLSGSSSNIREVKSFKSPQSASETALYGRAEVLDVNEVNPLVIKGSGKAKSGQISVLSCPSLHPVSSSVDDVFVESESGPNVSATLSEEDIYFNIDEKDLRLRGNRSTVKKKLKSVEDVKTDEKVASGKERSYSLTSLLSNIKRKTSEDHSKSVAIEQKSSSTSTQSTICVDDKFESVQQISDSDLTERDPSAIEGQDELNERRGSVASTASEGRGSQRVNRIVSSTLGQWKRFQGSLGSLSTNIKQHYQQKYKKRLSKEDAGKEINTSACFEKSSEDLQEENLEQRSLSEQKRAASLSTSLESHHFERQEDDNFWNKKLELHDLAKRKEKEISNLYSSSFDKDPYLHESAMPDENQDIKDLRYYVGDVVSPLSVSECTGEVSSASNSSGTTSSEGGDASIQSFLSVIVKVKPETDVQCSVDGSQSEVMDDEKAEEKTIEDEEPYTEELSSLVTDDETKMDYEESDVGISSIEDKVQEFEEASEDEEATPSHTRRRPSEKISREISEDEDMEGEPLPKRPSLIVAVGHSEEKLDSFVLEGEMSPSKDVKSSIVSTRRLFCEGMLGSDVETGGVDSNYDSDSKLCDNSNVKIDDTTVTSALEKNNTHKETPLDRHLREEIYSHDDLESDDVSDSIGSRDVEVAKYNESESEKEHFPSVVNERYDGTHEYVGSLITSSPEKESQSKGEEGVISREDALLGDVLTERTSQEVSESKSLSSKFYDENLDDIRAIGDQDFLPERVDHMKIDREITKEIISSEQDSELEQEDIRSDREVPDIEDGAGQSISVAELETVDIVGDDRAQGEVQEEEIKMHDESKQFHIDGAYSLCKEEEALVSVAASGPKIVVTGAVSTSDIDVPSPPAIMLETGSVTSDDSLSEALAQTQGTVYNQQSSSSNLAAHLVAHPHRPPTPKSPITVDEWVAALPHPTSVDDDGEAWSGCEQSSEDLAEDLLSLGDEAGLISGSGTRGSVSAASLVGGSSTCTRDSMIGSHMIGAQNSESSTNVAATRDPNLAQLPLSSPQHHGMGHPMSPSHGNRPITLSDVENTMQKQMPAVSPIGVEGRRSQFASLRDKQTSFQSDLSGLSLQSRSSIDSLLDSRQADPVDVLLSLGFGAQSQEGLARVPERFLRPSRVRGNNIDEFIRSEDEFSDMMESAEWMPGLDPQALRRSSVATVSPLMSQILDNIRENRSRYLQSKDSLQRAPSQPTLTGASRFASIAKNIGTKSSIMKSLTGNTNKLSVLNPENRRLLDLQGQKSPEVPRKRLIIGQSSFDLGRDGELLANNEGNNGDDISNEEDSVAEEDSLDEVSSDEDEDDDVAVVGVRRFTQRPPLQHKESVWSMASSATSIDSNEEELRDQRRKLQLSLNRRSTPPEGPGTPPTPGDSLDSPTSLYSGADGVNRRRNIFKRLSQSKRVSTVSSGGSWDLDEKIPEEEMEEESFHEVQEQIIQESVQSQAFSCPDQLLATAPVGSEYERCKENAFLSESFVPNQGASLVIADIAPHSHSLVKPANQNLDTNVYQFDTCKSCGVVPHVSAGNGESTYFNKENGVSHESRRNTSPPRNASSLRRQERVEDGSPCGNLMSPTLLQIPSHPPFNNSLTDQDDASRSGNTGPLHRSGSAQSDSSGFMEGDIADGENRNFASSQIPNVHTWWWSHESAGSVETVRHVPISNASPLRQNHGSLAPRARSLDQQPTILQQRNSSCGYSSHTCQQQGSHPYKHHGENQRTNSVRCSNSCHITSPEHSLSSGSHVFCPIHSADGHRAVSERGLTNTSITAPSIVGYQTHMFLQDHSSNTCSSVPHVGHVAKCVCNFLCPVFAASSGKSDLHSNGSSLLCCRRNSLPESFLASCASNNVNSSVDALCNVHSSKCVMSSPLCELEKSSPSLSSPAVFQFISASDNIQPVEPFGSSQSSSSQLSSVSEPAYLYTETNFLPSYHASCEGNVDSRRISNKATPLLCGDYSSLETLMNALQSYRNQLVQQEHLSRTLHATTAFSLNNANHFSKQLHSISAIRAAIRAEVTHMEQLLANAKPNSFDKACINSVMMQMVSLLRKQAELCHDIERLTLSPTLSSPKSDDSMSSKALSGSSLSNECDVINSVATMDVNTKCSSGGSDIAEAFSQFSQPENFHCGSNTDIPSPCDLHKPVVENIGIQNLNPVSSNSQTTRSIESEKNSNPNLCSNNENFHGTKDANVHKLCKSLLYSPSIEQTRFVKTCDSVKGSESRLDEKQVNSSDVTARVDSTCVEMNSASPSDSSMKPNAPSAASSEDVHWVTQLVETQVRNQTQIVQAHLNQQSREMEDIKSMLKLLLNRTR